MDKFSFLAVVLLASASLLLTSCTAETTTTTAQQTRVKRPAAVGPAPQTGSYIR
jgi:outer membrane biogenesis lipoprotein LolB